MGRGEFMRRHRQDTCATPVCRGGLTSAMSANQMLEEKFGAALPYGAYVATGKPEQRDKWGSGAAAVSLMDEQKALIGGFTRRVNVLVLSGIWCGDCAAQCPMLAAA